MAAKYARPRTDHAVLRAEFLPVFAAAARKRLLLLCAPAGYGKTTNVADALDRLDLGFIWYKLDVLDHDPVVFLASLGEAVNQRFPAFGEILRERLRSSSNVPFPLEEMTAVFVAECERHLDAPMHVVLDDYHEASDAHDLNRVIDYLVANAPATVRFVVLTRYEPAFSTARLRLEDRLSTLGADDLRFSVEQAAEVVFNRSGKHPETKDIERLVQITEGWPAAIVLAGLTLDWLDLDSLPSVLADPRLKKDIYSYLAEQVFLREDEPTRHFLKRTSCLEHVNAALGDRLAGGDDAHRRLAHLAANRVFTFPTAESGTYRYHNLFRDYLRQRYLLDHGEPAFRQLQLQTAEALEDAGEYEMAVELLLKANEPTLAVESIARTGQRGLDGLGLDCLKSWLARLRPGPAQNHPWVGLISSQIPLREGSYDFALDELEQSIAGFRKSGDSWGLFHALSTKEFTQFWSADYAGAIGTSQSALAVAPGPTQAVHSLLSMGSAAAQVCDWDTMEAAYAQAESLARDAEPEERLRASALRAHGLFFRGDFRGARRGMESTLAAVRPGLFRASVLESIGAAETALGEYPAALAHLVEAYVLSDSVGWAPGLPLVVDNLGACLGSAGRHELGIALCRTAATDPLMQSDAAMHALCLSHVGTILRRHGRAQEARDIYSEALQVAGRSRNAYVKLNCRVNAAATELAASGETGSALEPLVAASRKARLPFLELKTILFAGILDHRAVSSVRGQTLWGDCMRSQLRLGHLNLLAHELTPHPDLVERVLDSLASLNDRRSLVSALACSDRSRLLLRRLAESRPDLSEAAQTALANQESRRRGVSSGIDAVVRIPALANILTAFFTEGGRIELRDDDALKQLSAREREVLSLMAAGFRNPDIAARLVISPATVKTHVNRIFTKLGVRDRVHAVLLYRESVERSAL